MAPVSLHPNCMKLPNHPCHTPAQPPTQTAQRGHRSASPGVGRLVAAFEAGRANELAAAYQLSKPRHSMLYPAYTRLVDAFGAVRLKCNDIRLAIRAHRKELRDKGK